jgi:carbonic anhydrase
MFTRKSYLKLLPFLGLLIFYSCNMESNKTEQGSSEPVMVEDYVTQTSGTQSSMTPSEAIQMLKEGNDRFLNDQMINRDLLAQVEQTGNGQYPFAAVVSCIDSRIPTEIIFDQGVGDIFNARIAGNFVNTDILGSLEFATAAAGSKAILVLGHTHCGAVKGAADDVKLGNLTATLEKIKPAIDAVENVEGERNSSNAEYVQKIADKNVELTIEKIKSDSPVIRDLYEKGKVAIIGAMYDVETGKVTFMNM